MQIWELFVADITRDIPPVVYFHEQTPAKLASEVSEYIITGGNPPGGPRIRRTENGIHDEMTRLLRNIVREMDVHGGPSLPASWISGFYGSGKSSFAKLLGLAIDGKVLPDGTLLAEALLKRDDSPKNAELRDAWEKFTKVFGACISVVFDIGATARDNQHVHHAVVRQLQERLGYCKRDPNVADFEMRLERDGLYPQFLAVADKKLGRPWDTAKNEAMAEDHFSFVLHHMDSERYRDPMSWVESRAGSRHSGDASPVECVNAIESMLDARGQDRPLFIVVDEVSQFVAQDDNNRMLRLQSFVENLGSRMKGRAWFLATGQQKLETESVAGNIGKLKDRFPPHLRVHLATTNIRDVVHKRLLKKRTDREDTLRTLFQTHRADLKRFAYDGENLTEEDFVEVYPMLPGYVDLLLEITSALRLASSRVQGDDYAIRGLLQLLGELFRSQGFSKRAVGDLVTIDTIYEVQHTALDPDVQNTMARILENPKVTESPLVGRVAKAVALLELVQERPGLATTAELVARCLYATVGQGGQIDEVKAALDELHTGSLLSYAEKLGYKIQSSAGQEWARERDAMGVTPAQRSDVIQQELGMLVGTAERPKYKGAPFGWLTLYSDGREASDVRLRDGRADIAATVDFRFLLSRPEREPNLWLASTNEPTLFDRIVWINGEPGTVNDLAAQVVRSSKMVRSHEGKVAALSHEKQRLYHEEVRRAEETTRKLRDAVADVFLSGEIYFRGTSTSPRELGKSFSEVLVTAAERRLPQLFDKFVPISVSDKELEQLLSPTFAGISSKFLDGEGGLGIITSDAGRHVARCEGELPRRIKAHIDETGGLSGLALIQHFMRPPHGYAPDVVRACVLGLLRARLIRVEPEQGKTITSVQDEGANDVFRRSTDFRKATVLPPKENEIPPRAPIAIAKFFAQSLGHPIEPEFDAIAQGVFDHFGGVRERLRKVEWALQEFPGSTRAASAPANPRKGARKLPTLEAGRRHRSSHVQAPNRSGRRRRAAEDLRGRDHRRGGVGRPQGRQRAQRAPRAASSCGRAWRRYGRGRAIRAALEEHAALARHGNTEPARRSLGRAVSRGARRVGAPEHTHR